MLRGTWIDDLPLSRKDRYGDDKRCRATMRIVILTEDVLVEYGQHILANVIVGGSAPQQRAKTAVHD